MNLHCKEVISIKTYSAFLLLTFCFSISFAQAPETLWTQTYGGIAYDVGRSVQQTSDGGYIITGSTLSYGAGWTDIYLVKTDAKGNILWEKTYGGTDFDEGYSVRESYDGGYIIAGYTDSWGAGGCDVYFIKTDMNGDTLWTKTYGGINDDYGVSVVQTSDSGYILSGNTTSFGAGLQDVYLIKTGKNGDTLWTKTFGWANMDFGNSIALTPDDGYIIVGVTYSSSNYEGDIYVVKTDQNGIPIWTKTYGDSTYEWGGSIAVTSGGGYIVTGEKSISRNINGSQPRKRLYSPIGQLLISLRLQDIDVWILKLNAAGDTIWTRSCGRLERDCGYSVQESFDGGFVIAGSINILSGSYDSDVYLIKTDSLGDTLWTTTYGGVKNDCGYSVQQTLDNGFIIVGYTESFGEGDADIWLIKTEPDVGIPEQSSFQNISPFLQIIPNPCHDKTNIRVQMRQGINTKQNLAVNIKIYDVSGCLVKDLAHFILKESSPMLITWDGRDNSDKEISSGIYFIRLDVNEHTEIKKLILLR